ncbi:NnrS family protein [Citreimonas salinaria]|uniref:Uncharacterized protein involved in response to NO n=1 Tax=Citreimonas salinaria TaxID=321339 RepID=A0A1H3MU16_9RHOB|nr:NnrS family protein [Citreimonas salinaria]SDY79950.1 uncharacterized protein involved in response to NO [Citreimonas salinaria]
MSQGDTYQGPALFSYGFRPFFLAAFLSALVLVPLWWLIWRGDVALAGHFTPVDWHVHEMVFGYGAAVVAGFLFTAVPNWTGRRPTRGWPLIVLLSIWMAGRLAVAGLTGLGPLAVAFVDQAFMLAVAVMIAHEIAAGRNWRNLMVLIPVSLLWLANALFHAEALTQGSADLSRRLGIALLVFLILLIGGRILPAFTRNWLVKRGATRLPATFDRLDGLCLLSGALALILWVVLPDHPATAGFAALAAILHLVRVLRWCGWATWQSPLLLMLHIAYLTVPLGFAAIAAAPFGVAGPAGAAHIFGIGSVGGMTVAVMMRATMGHTGRALVAGAPLMVSFLLIVGAAAARVVGPGFAPTNVDGVSLSALLWTCAFAILVWRIGPWLARPGLQSGASATVSR